MLIRTQIDSAHLAGNLLGDPSRRPLFVYLPPGYTDSERHYPTAYLLHAFGSSAELMVAPAIDGPRWTPPIEDVLDPVFGRMGVAPMIVVIPDGWTRWGCSQWVDSPVNGNFEQYLLHEVVAHVDANYRTLAQAASRGVFGFSSGGFGAWHLASRNPEVFGATALLSADSYFELTHKPALYKYLDSVRPAAPDGPVEGNDRSQLVYALAACYSPNPARPPLHVDLPVDPVSGTLLQVVWERWLAFDPVINVRDRLDKLRRLRGILLDVGVHDEYHAQWGHRQLSQRLHDAGIAHEARENCGNHGGRSRERIQVALQWLAQVLACDAD